MDYKNGKIYRIVCNETGLCYVGSTTQTLTKRLSKHKESYKNFLNDKYHFVTSFKILENENYDIVLIEEYPCENKQQLHARERYYIETMECVNMRIPSRTPQEYYQCNKESRIENTKKWREEHKEYIKEFDKKRKNGEKKQEILEKAREYYQKNKDEINRKRREKYTKNKKNLM